MLTKARLLEGLVLVCVNPLSPPLPPTPPPPTVKAVYMALDKHLDGEELWVVGYMQVVPGAEIRVGSHQGRVTGGREKGAESRGQKARVSCSICECGAQTGGRSTPSPGCN